MNYHLKGLNTLRFFAAVLVILFHSVTTFGRFKIIDIGLYPIFNKSDEAVSFFFTLSGFLITYLLLIERKKNNIINVKAFYLRRILRIWPLYFFVVLFGLVFYNFILPMLDVSYPVEYGFIYAVFLYVLFLPNVLSTTYDVGGILNPTWSIGVEEQFYLIWAPLINVFKKGTISILIFIFIFFLLIRVIASYRLFGINENNIGFIYTLRFHYMAFGGIGAYLVVNSREKITELKILKSKLSQIIHFILLFAWLFFYNNQFSAYFHFIFIEIFVMYLFIWLILNVSLIESTIFKYELKLTNWLGMISYGLYLLHMIVITGVLFIFKRYSITCLGNSFTSWLLVLSILVGTILISTLSYYFFEKPFLNLKKKYQKI